MPKIDNSLVNALCVESNAYAVVRVRTPAQLGYVARRFDVVAAFPFINALGIRCNRNEVNRLAAMQEVECVTAQGRVSALDGVRRTKRTFPAKDEESARVHRAESGNTNDLSSRIGASTDENSVYAEIFGRPNELTGAGVTLCVMDTGVSPHTDICVPKDRIKVFKDLVGGKEFAYDDNGHGTFVAGVAAGNGVLSANKIKGVAPCAEIVGLKVISASGETGTFKILEGMQWLYEHAEELGVKVVCMSFGADPVARADPLKLGAEMLSRSGLTVVCAAGNSGAGGLKSPGVSAEVITVGAVDDDLNPAEFSSSGVYQGVFRPDLYAPGVKIRGVDAGGTYSVMSGTSVSAPYVAGACCLLHERFRRLTPREAKQMLIRACADVRGIKVFSMER